MEYLAPATDRAMNTLEYHVLLALAKGPLYGYAIKDAIATESGGTLEPRAGTLYRVIARLMTGGLVAEAEPAEASEPHPGLARKYYGLTMGGRAALAAEARRLRGAATLAEERLGSAGGRP
jgi:DNA-binding PadR family transcriptional regulator